METEKCMKRATCFDCIYAIHDCDATYCREASRVISDEQGYGDIKICEKFRRLAYGTTST